MRARTFAGLAAVLAACSGPSDVPDGGASDAGDASNDSTDEQDAIAGTVGLMLVGTIVTPDSVIDGEVLVLGQTIACVDVASVCDALPEAANALVVHTNGIIAPGLIDTHNHVLFDIFDND